MARNRNMKDLKGILGRLKDYYAAGEQLKKIDTQLAGTRRSIADIEASMSGKSQGVSSVYNRPSPPNRAVRSDATGQAVVVRDHLAHVYEARLQKLQVLEGELMEEHFDLEDRVARFRVAYESLEDDDRYLLEERYMLNKSGVAIGVTEGRDDSTIYYHVAMALNRLEQALQGL